MANHCFNWVCFEGDKATLDQLMYKIKESIDSTEYFDKQAEIVLGKSYWNRNHSIYDVYGTRWWDIDLVEWSEDFSSFVVQGASAWSPPSEYVRLISEIYGVHAVIEFEETGNDFGGREIYKDGKVLSSESMSYNEWMYKEEPTFAVERFLEDLEDNIECYEDVQSLLTEITHMSAEHQEEIVNQFKEYANNK
mgnify:CR=1 FL=1